MKYWTLLLAGLFLATHASAQGLADIAAKEKKRREAARAEGKTVKEYEAVVGSSPEAEDEEEDADGDDALSRRIEALESRSGKPSEDAAPSDEFEWRSIYGHYKVKYLHLENLMDMLDSREAKWCTPPPAASERNKIGPEMEQYRRECREVRDEQSALRSEMRAMQSDCLAEAKRFGVSPGNARLGR